MLNFLMRLGVVVALIGWWGNNGKRAIFLAFTLGAIYYVNGELEGYLAFFEAEAGQQQWLKYLLVGKNIAYSLAVLTFLLWPWVFPTREKSRQDNARSEQIVSKKDGFDEIRNKSKLRTRASMILNESDKNKK